MNIEKDDLLKIKTFQDIVFLAIKPSFLDKLEEVKEVKVVPPKIDKKTEALKAKLEAQKAATKAKEEQIAKLMKELEDAKVEELIEDIEEPIEEE